MNLIGTRVKHARFGAGSIFKQENGYLFVRFDAPYGEKMFIYPDAFGDFLSLEDSALGETLQIALQEKRQRAAQERAARDEKMRAFQEKIAAEKSAAHPVRAKTAPRKLKPTPRPTTTAPS